MLVARDVADRPELIVAAACFSGRRPPLLRAQSKRVLLLARDAPALGHVLPRLAHRLEWEHCLHPRIWKAPAELRVPLGVVAEAGTRARERRARHRLDAAGDEEIAVTRNYG